MERVVCALFPTERRANEVVKGLVDGGFDHGVISVVMHSEDIPHEDVEGHGTKMRERAIGGGLLAGSVGALLGGLIAGPIGLVGAGPIAAALFGVGGVYGAVAGTLTGRDAEHSKLKRLREQVQDGAVLVAIEATNNRVAEELEERLQAEGGERTEIL